MNRTVALLLLLLVVTNAAWMIYSGHTPEPELRRPPAPTAEPPPGPTIETPRGEASVREVEMAAEIVRLKKRLAFHERHLRATASKPDPARAERVKAAAEAKKARDETMAHARKQSSQWVADVKQIEDPALRARALDEMRSALSSFEEGTALAGLLALSGSYGVDYDRASFGPLVVPHLQAGDPAIRSTAVRALWATKPGREGIANLLPLAGDPDPQVLGALPLVLVQMSEYRPDEATGRALVRLLSHENSRVRSSVLEAMDHVRELTPELEEKLVAMASSTDRRDRRNRQRVLYALGRLGKKSDRVVDLLLPYLEEDHYNGRLVAYRGLERGVPDSAKRKVADAVVKAAPKLPDYNNLMMCFRILNRCADKSHLEAMERLATNPMLSESIQKRFDDWLKTLRSWVGS